MSIHILIEKFQHAGIGFKLSPTGLMVVASPGTVTPDLLAEIKANKPALLAALGTNKEALPDLPDHTLPLPKNGESSSERPSCFSCGHFDGKGATWPGTCRYFETIGEPAKEIDFNRVDPLHGCKCFTPESDTKRLQVIKGQKKRRLPPGDDPGWFTPGQDGPQRRRSKERPSSVALAWLRDNIVPLRAGGWTASQLWRRNKSKGICWCELWDAPFLKAYLHDNGVIEFECVIEGRDIIQSARPMHQARKIVGGYRNECISK